MGSEQWDKPYSASVLNIGAMSYDALSKTTIQTLNVGAQLGRFAQNTTEAGIDLCHLMGRH